MTRGGSGRFVAVAVALALAAGACRPTGAAAAFDLRDASPASLGAASLDREPGWVPEPAASAASGGIRIGAAASRYRSAAEVEIARLDLAVEGARRCLAGSYTQVGVDFARESTLRIAVRETAGRGIALEVCGERLDLRVEGEPSRGGWAAGGRALAMMPAGGLDVAVEVGADRFLRSGGLAGLGVSPSLPFALSLRGPGGAVTWIDRWESGGARSPRLVLDLALAGTLRLRLARGGDPGRTGVAVALRLSEFEIAAGHLDLDSGIAVAGASIRYRISGRSRGGKPAAGSGALLL